MKKYIISSLLLVILLVSCKSQKENKKPEETAKSTETVADKNKTIFNIDDLSSAYYIVFVEEIPAMEKIVPTMIIDATGKISGSNGCNSYFGKLNMASEGNIIEKLGSTRKMCEGMANDIETRFMARLREANNIQFDGRDLSFLLGDKPVIKARKVSLDGEWQLLTFGDKDVQANNLNFNISETRLNGNTGCNDFSGQVDRINFDLGFSEMVATEKACEGMDMTFESNFLNSFDKVTKFQMNESFVTFFYNNEVLFTAKKADE